MSQNDLVIINQSFPSFRTDLNSALQAINSSHSGSSIPSGAVAGTIWLDTTSATSPTLKFYDGTDSISLAIIDYTNNTVNWLDSSISYNTTATSAGTLTLTVSSSYKQYLTGTTTHTVVLPVTSTLTLGQTFQIHNNSTGSVTINSSGANLVGTLVADTTAEITCILTSGTTAASWDYYSITPTSLGTPLAVVGNATSGSEIRLPEDTDNGSNYVALKAADTIASNLTLTLPSADGTSGQVLQTDGSGVLSFSSASSDYVRLATTTVSSSVSEVNFTTGFSDTYKIYEIELINVDTSTANFLFFRWGYGATPTYITSGYIDFAQGMTGFTDSTFTGKNTYNRTTAHEINAGDTTLGNTTGFTMNGKIRLFNSRSTSTYFKGFNSQVIYLHSGVDFGSSAHTCGFNNDTTLRDSAVTGFKIYTSTGNIDAGTFVLYGIKTA